jgi:hypothetical protein
MTALLRHKPQEKFEAVWTPIPDSSQEFAINSRAHITMYTGARGPGKTDTQLMRFRRNVGVGYGPFWRGVIFDREYKNLDDLVNKSRRWFNSFGDGARFLSSAQDYKWTWPTGEELLFRAIKKLDDYWNYHGQEFPFIGWNELCKYPTLELFDRMMTCNRSSYRPEDYPQTSAKGTYYLPQIPLEVFATTNPYGAGHAACKRRFIDPAPYGHVVKRTIDVFNPRTQKREPVTKTQVTIFGSYKENIYLSPEYIAELESISDENIKAAWLWGDWDIVAGGALSDVWRKNIHVLPAPTYEQLVQRNSTLIPEGWTLDRCFDWGSTHPFAVLWFAESNGEEMYLSDGKVFCPPAGTLLVFNEWYGTKEIGTNVGLRLSASDIAKGIKARELEMVERGIIATLPWPGPADNSIRDVRELDVDTIEKKMADENIHWQLSDKSPGSRKIGLQLVRERLECAIKGEGPAIYFMSNCVGAVSTLPSLPRDEEKIDDVDTDSEDHLYDVVRYRVLKGSNRAARSIRIKFPT